MALESARAWTKPVSGANPPGMPTLSDFSQPDLDGNETPLSTFGGRVALIVNVASRCGLTPHYEGLESLHRQHKDRGLVVLGFPCNQFGAQEPGSDEQIKSFCQSRYDVTFPMFSKIDVNGPDRHPLYAWLTGEDTKPEGSGDVQWNFTKFVVGRDGTVAGRFEPKTLPDDPSLLELIESKLV